MGFIMVSENAETGVMETDWAENRAKIPQDALRNLLGKVIDQAYSTPERDKFRIASRARQNRRARTEVYITHRGMYEMYVNDANIRQTGPHGMAAASGRPGTGSGDAASLADEVGGREGDRSAPGAGEAQRDRPSHARW